MNNPDELIVCRCESVSVGQIRSSIHDAGARTVNQVKKLTRAGMGLCQGRTCAGPVETMLAAEANVSFGSEPYKARPPVRGLTTGILAGGADLFDEPSGPVQLKAISSTASDHVGTKSEEK